MANTFKFGNGEWAVGKETALAYNDENDNYKPLPFDFDRGSTATRVNRDGLIETVATDEPRIDFLNNTKGHLLLEPERTNSFQQSNQFDTTWTLSASIDLTGGQNGVGGSNDAWLLKRNSTGSRYIQQSLSLSSAQYSYSVYLKAESTNWAFLWSYDGSASVNAYFDLENGVVGQIGGAALDSTNIESVGNGWYRCTLIYTHAPDLVRIYPAYSNGSVSTGTDNGIYIQYAQLEAGSYPTSYIPTQGSAVTRSAESCSGAGNSTVFNDSEGVLYAEIAALTEGGTSRRISISNGTTTDRIVIENDEQSGRYRFFISGGGSTIELTHKTGVTEKNYNKIAVSWNGANSKVYFNGEKTIPEKTDTPTISGLSVLQLQNSQATGGNLEGKVKDVRVYNTALTDAELIALTS